MIHRTQKGFASVLVNTFFKTSHTVHIRYVQFIYELYLTKLFFFLITMEEEQIRKKDDEFGF